MTLEILAYVALGLAAVPALMCLLNLTVFRGPRGVKGRSGRPASVLIPARNEAERIEATLYAVLADPDPDLDVVVMDDHSEDDTAARVRAIAARDPRVRLVDAPPLPEGWNGKQHACYALAGHARHETLVFLDADVELAPAAVQRITAYAGRSDAALVSGFPRQVTRTFFERLLIPLIHFVLLGFLPIPAMRRSRDPSFGAGCGQLMVARREAYARAGGHAAIRASRHDGVMLPRTFRKAGYATDLFDATDVASCRMYEDAKGVWDGLAKNATEGMASPRAILPWTILLLGGQVLPLVLFLQGVISGTWALATVLATIAVALVYLTRAALAVRFRQPLISVLLHPLGVVVLLAIQYFALVREARGRRVAWKGR